MVSALTVATFVNAAILIVAAATFYATGNTGVGDLPTAYQLLQPLLGSRVAPILFGVGLLAAGQNSTLTGVMAGQVRDGSGSGG
jgi:manganese transport protein